jgi:hypothetical protein
MRIYDYRKIYKQHYGAVPKDKDGRNYDIHHIDGNHTNDDPLNLKAVTIQEHYEIHLAQGDWAACLLIAQRMKVKPSDLSEIARQNTTRKNQREIAAGTHNFLGGEIQRKWNRSAVANGTHHLLGPKQNADRIAVGNHNWLGKKLCPHCNRSIPMNNYHRWHGSNCKLIRPSVIETTLHLVDHEI